jgi:thiol:disulfide interchange protein
MKTIRRPARPLALAAIATLALAAAAAGPLYPDTSRAAADIEAGLQQAAREHKRVLVDFGGDWCTDCRILDINFRRPENQALLASSYVLVHVNVGDKGITHNFEIAERYGIPLRKGVPALAVLDEAGNVVHAQKSGEFESMRSMDPASVNDFLARWRAR